MTSSTLQSDPALTDAMYLPTRNGRRLPFTALGILCAVGGGALLMPEDGWSRLSALLNLRTEQAEPAIVISEVEKQGLLALTQSGLPQPLIAGTDAIKANAAIPFSSQPVSAAKPFMIGAIAEVAGKTALRCMTQAIYYEAGFEPEQGKRAVAQVVLNRMRHPAFPKSVCGVVYEGANAPVCQFSFTCDGSLNRAPQRDAWLSAERIARNALQGHVETSVGYATHYHANYVSPYWAPRLTKLSQIGAHIFYRWPGGWGTPAAFNGRYTGYEAIPALLPRAAVTDLASVDDQTEALAKATLPANLVPVRHAVNDVGGRLDISKGWKLSIPSPADTRGASAALAARQQQAAPTGQAVAAASAEVSGL